MAQSFADGNVSLITGCGWRTCQIWCNISKLCLSYLEA